MGLRLFADENVYAEIVTRLRAGGMDVETVQEAGKAGASDANILRHARGTDRILLTFDRDFADIRYLPRDVPGIVLLRFRQTPIEDIAERAEDAVRGLGEKGIRDFLVVITLLHVRRRPLASVADA
ncbi:MAG: hypothetical protein G01um101438_1025 [Parcubacteria group bacterium Gr01-1014_38]|nr:MAG: hypothetical protein G01um101438_1025 [Parcubacteria group bacterium Gr01-1014_38]